MAGICIASGETEQKKQKANEQEAKAGRHLRDGSKRMQRQMKERDQLQEGEEQRGMGQEQCNQET